MLDSKKIYNPNADLLIYQYNRFYFFFMNLYCSKEIIAFMYSP